MAKIEQKQQVVTNLKNKLDGASSMVIVDYSGLTVEQDTELRKLMRENDVLYKVLKNSIMNFALEGTEFDELRQHLAGPTAVAVSYDDPTAGPRNLNTIAKKYEALEFKAGVVEKTYYDQTGIVALAQIPPKEELLSKLLGSLNSPIASFARVAKAIADKKAEEVQE